MLETTKEERRFWAKMAEAGAWRLSAATTGRLCRDVDKLVEALEDGQKEPDGRLVFRVAVLDLPAMPRSPQDVARELVAIWQRATRDAEYAVTKVIGQGPRTEAELVAGHNLEFNVRVELECSQARAVLGEE